MKLSHYRQSARFKRKKKKYKVKQINRNLVTQKIMKIVMKQHRQKINKKVRKRRNQNKKMR